MKNAIALELLADMDSLDLKVSDVVRAADRNNAIFYKLSGSRDGLIIAVVEHTTHEIVEVMRSRISTDPTKEEAGECLVQHPSRPGFAWALLEKRPANGP